MEWRHFIDTPLPIKLIALTPLVKCSIFIYFYSVICGILVYKYTIVWDYFDLFVYYYFLSLKWIPFLRISVSITNFCLIRTISLHLNKPGFVLVIELSKRIPTDVMKYITLLSFLRKFFLFLHGYSNPITFLIYSVMYFSTNLVTDRISFMIQSLWMLMINTVNIFNVSVLGFIVVCTSFVREFNFFMWYICITLLTDTYFPLPSSFLFFFTYLPTLMFVFSPKCSQPLIITRYLTPDTNLPIRNRLNVFLFFPFFSSSFFPSFLTSFLLFKKSRSDVFGFGSPNFYTSSFYSKSQDFRHLACWIRLFLLVQVMEV